MSTSGKGHKMPVNKADHSQFQPSQAPLSQAPSRLDTMQEPTNTGRTCSVCSQALKCRSRWLSRKMP